ncbi:accessory factor UbiK family protein [Halomonas kalidii]|uniref:Ubiquinone biosynthesis accessory factor UbiK n=1 Tax=Halomonas kalidii TaxID=3043293 RepID=A0ABT6VHU0_9GAMM|nr:accessory factor UbiK family protein [Halomonas kalidii]MDI5932568.1 accessory factor UbiK family protein [Halomonas kalidii]
MVSHDRISRLAQQIGDRLQGASQAPEEVQKGIQQVVRGAFDRLELVSREDFDILMDVLQRTRARVEALETQVAALEEALDARRTTGPGSGDNEPAAVDETVVSDESGGDSQIGR